jgi:hypothetical protein
MKKLLRSLECFFLAPASPRPIAVLRISLALVLLLQAFSLRHSFLDLLGNDGIVQGDLATYFSDSNAPRLSWITERLMQWNWPEVTVIQSICVIYVASLVLLLAGLFTRTASVTAWFLHWMLMNSSESTAYGMDAYAHVFLFYLIWVPAGSAFSLDVWLGRLRESASPYARLGLRVMQLQLCITYFCSALDKAKGPQWWNGEILWRALNLPVYRQYDFTWLAHWPTSLKVAGLMSLSLEGLYAVFIWPARTCPFWIMGIVGMHLGIALFLGLQLFGLIMCILTLSLFAVSPEPNLPQSYRVREEMEFNMA